ncbi:MAG: mechanosensitive ion channel [Saprospiraceae bacterium]|nr:mechanosensitive ion channel [Saprospiraceae bacterium]
MDFRAFLEYHLFGIGEYALTVAMVLGVVIIWTLCWLILRLAYRVIHRSKRVLPSSDYGRRHSLFLIVQYLLWTLAGVGMLKTIGIEVTVVLAGSAALLVGLGLGIQQIFRDIMSGIFLLFEGTVEVGDVLQVDGQLGKVIEINLRTSKLETPDGLVLIVPNYKFITETVVNWSHYDTQPSRFSVTVSVAHGADENQVRDIMLEVAGAHPRVLHDPQRPLQVRILDFTEQRIVFSVVFWTHHKFEVESTRNELRFSIWERLRLVGMAGGKG